jgi:hypothetical protein
MQFANSFHFPGSFEGLCVIDNEKQPAVLFVEQTQQHIQGDLLHHYRLIPDASPEEFTVIGAMSTVPQRLDKSVNRTAMADAYRQYHGPEIVVYMFGDLFFDRPEKTLQFFRNFADCNHTASMLISSCYQDTYRQMRLFLFDNQYHQQNSLNRSV